MTTPNVPFLPAYTARSPFDVDKTIPGVEHDPSLTDDLLGPRQAAPLGPDELRGSLDRPAASTESPTAMSGPDYQRPEQYLSDDGRPQLYGYANPTDVLQAVRDNRLDLTQVKPEHISPATASALLNWAREHGLTEVEAALQGVIDAHSSPSPNVTNTERRNEAPAPEKPKPYYRSLDELEAANRNKEVDLHKLGPDDVAPEVVDDLLRTFVDSEYGTTSTWAGLQLGKYTRDHLSNLRDQQLEQIAPDDLSQEIFGMQESDNNAPLSPERASRLNGARAATRLAVTNAAVKAVDVAQKVGAASARREEVAGLNGRQPRRLSKLGWTILAGAGVATAAIVADRLGINPFSGNTVQHAQTAADTVRGGGVGHAAGSTVHNLPSGSGSTAHQAVQAPGMRHATPPTAHPPAQGNGGIAPRVDGGNPNLAPNTAATPQSPLHSGISQNPDGGVQLNLPQHAGDTGVTPQPPTVPLESLTRPGDTVSDHVLSQLHHLGFHIGNGQGGISQDDFNRHFVASTLTDNNLSFEQARHMQVGSTFHLLPEATMRQMMEEFGKS